ncbi:GntR family transcriptional regulator [Arthrobacter sp. B2a2-09]|uniref:GntR family transcriptional regulator n=1 Tax=Arthrobacter sp. B2a2-09 TaxID=2952822 RepID=UPI0022CD4E85|nr:GntR family transcriptional regulator [Arthrobacter sp. B2a2-09]MCZ9884931.1 GntR family transcriptional regulator [Arthrobacter sp. B2a2-09]
MAMMRTLRAQAAEELRGVLTKDYRVGERLPPEAEMAKRMGLSRNTVREAIAELVMEGRLDRKWGVGTTVLEPRRPATFSATDVGPIRDIIRASGHTPGLGRFRAEMLVPPSEVADALGVSEGESVWYVERLFVIDDVPAVLLRDWCLTRINGTAVDVSSLKEVDIDLISLIRDQTGQALRRLEGRIDAMPAPEDFIPDRRPVVQISQSCLTGDDVTLIYSTIQFDTSVVDLTIRRVFA